MTDIAVLDQMARYHTSKSAIRRWPVVVFFNVLDFTCINAYILLCLINKSKLLKRKFFLQPIEEICKPNCKLVTASHLLHTHRYIAAAVTTLTRKESGEIASLLPVEINLDPPVELADKFVMKSTHSRKDLHL